MPAIRPPSPPPGRATRPPESADPTPWIRLATFRRPVAGWRASLRRTAPTASLAAALVVGAPGPVVPSRPPGPAAGDCRITPDSLLVPPSLARELRGAWLTPVDGGEWPSRPGMSDEAQQRELRAALDRAVAVGLNAVVLHVRPAADAFYPTGRAPWSGYLVGRGGAPPGYDPLAFAVEEAHRRGIQLHVWFNPFRAAPPDGAPAEGARILARTRPEWLVRYGSQQWVDPGFPEARRAVLDAILEVVERYDVDAVHLDDYFYPYREERVRRERVGRGRRRRTVVTRETIPFPDAASWARHGRAAGFDDRSHWRRENISRFVEALYGEVKARKPWVLVGISPFGIWRSGYPRGVTGLDAYGEIYADSRRWLREGWVDYLAPQLYWRLDGEQARFTRLDAWWRTENPHGRHLWPGLLTMRVTSRQAPWPAAEIPAQIRALRDARAGSEESQGHVHFRLAPLLRPAGAALVDGLTASVYAEPALPPASPWLGAARPAPPAIQWQCAVAPLPGAGDAPPAAPPLEILPATGDTVSVRWWLVQLQDRAGRWASAVRPVGDRLVRPVVGDSAAAVVSVTAVSASGVVGLPTLVRLD